MSILSSITSIFGLAKSLGIGVPTEECAPSKPDDCSDGKQSKWNDDHGGRGVYSKNGDNDEYSSGKDDSSKDGPGDYSKHYGGWMDAKDHNYQPKDSCDLRSDDAGGGDTYGNPGEALARFDFSHGDFGSHSPDHVSDIHGALASMSSDDALEYAIGQMGPVDADHVDVGHFDAATDTSHNTDA
ncbi:hypothetical protein [Bradyrhizobium sp. B117]|uniref:hypothetical protein n=1 Tax=Bradyrhizobium sp. B117 TaxID=3140246 RepID=UPI003183287A